MKPIGKRILACLVTACLLLGCISFLSGVLMRKSGAYNYYGFFSQEEEFDVLFFGSSHVVNGVMPMELWRDWGIVSFNMANTGCMIPTSYWMLELALRYKTPSVAVIDCMGLESNFKTFPERFEQVSVTLDAFPLSRTKIRAAMDLLDDPYMDEAIANGETEAMEGRDPLSLLWPFSIYHRRWKELKASDFVPSYNREKGGRMMAGHMRQRNIGAISPEAKLEGDTVGIEYLEKMIQLCQSRGIEVLLINIPYPAIEEQIAGARRVYDIAEEYGVNYLNFLEMDVVDFDTDCYDSHSHLNASGAEKVTAYLGNYLREQYRVPDRRGDERYAFWKQDYILFQEALVSKMQDQTELTAWLSLLYNKRYDLRIEFRDRRILDSEMYCRMLENLGVDASQVQQNGTGVYLHGNREAKYRVLEKPPKESLRITVFNARTKEKIDQVVVSFVFDEEQLEPVSVISFTHLSD